MLGWGRKPWQDVKQVETAPPDRQQLHACAGCNVTGKGQKETTQREIGNRRPGVGVRPRDQREPQARGVGGGKRGVEEDLGFGFCLHVCSLKGQESSQAGLEPGRIPPSAGAGTSLPPVSTQDTGLSGHWGPGV